MLFVSFALVKIRFIFMNRLELTDPLSIHNSVIILFCRGIVSLLLINELFMVSFYSGGQEHIENTQTT